MKRTSHQHAGVPISVRQLVGLAAIALAIVFGGRELRIGFTIIAGLLALVSFFPKSPISRSLFSRVGPSLDATSMTRSECLRAAGGLAFIAGLSVLTLYGIIAVGKALGRDANDILPLAAAMFMYGLFVLMGVAGALYLLMRAPFRPAVPRKDDTE